MSVLVWVVSVLVAGLVPAQVGLVRWVPGVGLAPHQEPVQVPGVWGPHQATGPALGPVVWLPVAQVQTHEPAELPVVPVLVVMVLVLLLVLAAVGVTDKTNVAGYKQSPQR